MRYLVLDTETTGVDYDCDITQLSCIELNKELKPTRTLNKFIYTTKPITSQVASITGINKQQLAILSNEKVLADVIDELYDILYSDPETIIVGHNVSFDIIRLNNNLARAGYDCIPFTSQICTMQLMKSIVAIKRKQARTGRIYLKDPKLVEAVEYMNTHTPITKEFMDRFYKALWGGESKYHDARYDTLATYLLFKTFSK